MKKTINKIIFIFALVILVNIIPTEAKAATYGITFPSSIVYVNMTMGVHYGTSGYTTASTTAYQSDRILINATVTHPEGAVGVFAGIVGWNYSSSGGGFLSGIPSNPYVATFNYDSILGDLSSGGANSLRFTTPKVNGDYSIRLSAYVEGNSSYADVLLFTVASAPAVSTTAYWCTNSSDTTTCTVPITGAVTPGTPLIFKYQPNGFNQGSTCTITKPDATTITITPTLNAVNNYPPSGIVAAVSTGTYLFRCNNPKLLAVNTDSIGQITGRAVGVSTYVLPTGLIYSQALFAMTSDNTPTEIGFKYYTGDSNYYNNGGNPYALTQVVCSGNCETGQYSTQRYTTYISGLASSSSYYIQSYAKNALGTITWGNARKFTTRGSDCVGLDPSGNCSSCAGKTFPLGDNICR